MPTKTETRVKPLGDRVLVEPIEQEEKTAGGVILADTAKEKPQRGKVLEVGTGRVTDEGKTIPLAVQKGQTIIYGKYSPTEIKLDGREYLIVRESDILAIVD